jgi:cysteine-rich repeat protein
MWGAAMATGVAVLWMACLTPAATTCADGSLCSAAQVCAPAGGCVDPAQLAACDDVADGEACELAGIGTGTCVERVCVLGGCGNGDPDPGEACDDGNTVSGDGCRADCAKVEVCGDGVVDAAEPCDDGNGNPVDGCDACVATSWRAEALLAGAVEGTAAPLSRPGQMAGDRAGAIYIADAGDCRIRRLDPVGSITTIAGTGVCGFRGDGGPATAALLAEPSGVAVDGAGNVYIADRGNHRIRKVDSAGVISTVAGSGAMGFDGDGGAATVAMLSSPGGIGVDGLGALYIADTGNHRIRHVAPDGQISTFAGTGDPYSSEDGGLATEASLRSPEAVFVDLAGSVYIADTGNHRVRVVGLDGIIWGVAGSGGESMLGDGGPALEALLESPHGVVVDAQGTLYVADAFMHRIRRVGPDGIISTVAGTGISGFAGDGGPSAEALVDAPMGVAVDAAGRLIIADSGNQRVRRVSAGGTIATVAGTGGDDGSSAVATTARLITPTDVAVDGAGALYLVDLDDNRVRRVDLDGVITTVAGNGAAGSAGDGGPAIAAELSHPISIAIDSDGAIYIADSANHRIRKVALDGTITTLAGTGTQGDSGDGGPATAAQLRFPYGVAVDQAGSVYIADTGNHRVRKVALDGTISPMAGTGAAGASSGDGGPATAARLWYPTGVTVDSAGVVYIADTSNRRIRKVGLDGIITTIAGTGAPGFAGDGGPATAAQLDGPTDVAVDAAGSVYIADRENYRVRKVAPDGTISTVAGTGTPGRIGDGGSAQVAQLTYPNGLALAGDGALLVADWSGARVRRVGPDGTITTVAGAVDAEGIGALSAAKLAGPVAIDRGPAFTLLAGGAFGLVQAIRADGDQLESVAGRYPHELATGDLARFRSDAFGSVEGVAFDGSVGDHGGIYLSETSGARLHLVTIVDPDDAGTWTITALGAGAPGYLDGPLATARFRAPAGLLLDEARRVLYVADRGNHVIRAIDLAAAGQPVATLAGTPATLGYFGDGLAATSALLYAPTTMALAPNGDLFLADTGNHRIRRVEAGSGVITTVLGDGVAASSGEGAPAWTFPVNGPRGLAVDALGNLFVTSSTAVRLLPANGSGVVDGSGPVQTIYGTAPRDEFPASATSCLTAIVVVDAETVHTTDACSGLLVELWRQPVAP